MAGLSFQGSEDLEKWLKEQPRDVAVAIAARTLLRVLPMVSAILRFPPVDAGEISDSVFLPVLRAALVTWVASIVPRDTEAGGSLAVAAEAARAGADDASRASAIALRGGVGRVLGGATEDVAKAATAAVGAIIGPDFAGRAASAAWLSADAASRQLAEGEGIAGTQSARIGSEEAPAQVWRAISDDASASSHEISLSPLWMAEAPDWATQRWGSFSDRLLSLDEGWSFWIDWYRARLVGGLTWLELTDEQNQSLELAIATLPDELWRQGAQSVNGEIKRLLDRHSSRAAATDIAVELLDKELSATGLRPSSALRELFRQASLLGPRRTKSNSMLTTSLPIFAAIDIGTSERSDEDWGFLTAFSRIVRETAGAGYDRVRGQYFLPDASRPSANSVNSLSDNVQRALNGAAKFSASTTPAGLLGVEAFLLALLDSPLGNARRNLENMGVEIAALAERLRTPEIIDALWKTPAQPAPPLGPTDLTFLGDRPENEHDYLGRADVAFILAAKLNQVWDVLQSKDEAAGTADRDPGDIDSALWTGLKPLIERARGEIGEGGFVVHVDAPWGGGKTTFANYLKLVLNPYMRPGPLPDWPAIAKLKDVSGKYWPVRFRRPWHIVEFNAWQHQHVTPPWWCFYQAIRKQCFHAIRTQDGHDADPKLPPPSSDVAFQGRQERLSEFLSLWAREIWWRVATPKLTALVATAIPAFVVAALIYTFGMTDAEGKLTADNIPAILVAGLSLLLGGFSAVWAAVSLLTESLLPGTPNAAENYSLGSGDPLERFRLHFSRTMKRLRRPILVIIDDLDRCEPGFVVELIRGMQTILRSPRVIFLILGDRDWIEHAFAEAHKTMQGIDVGPEHSFGARFVEKAIQLSFVLPDIKSEDRTSFVQTLLRVDTGSLEKVAQQDQTAARLLDQAQQLSATPGTINRDAQVQTILDSAKSIQHKETQAFVVKHVNREAALLNAVDERLQLATQHRLVPLAPVLPANPRQIKRIINAVALFQEIARLEASIQPGDEDWQKLTQWVVLMTEYPQTWFTVSRYPGLAGALAAPATPPAPISLLEARTAEHWLKLMRKDVTVLKLLSFDGWKAGTVSTIRADTVETFRIILPATSGTLLPLPPRSQQDTDQAAAPADQSARSS